MKVAAQLAKKNESEIYVLNSLELPTHLSSSGANGAMPESLFFIKLAEKYFEELLKRLEKNSDIDSVTFDTDKKRFYEIGSLHGIKDTEDFLNK